MRSFLKFIIILLVVLALIALVLMAVSPKSLELAESEKIDAPPSMIYNMVNDLQQWESWSPWADLDPNAKNSYTENTVGVGAQWNWDGNKEVGKGYQKIVASVQGESIKTELGFDGWDGISHSNWTFEPSGKGTKVVWDFVGGETPFVFRPFNLFMKGGLKKTYAKGLNKIKELAEERAQNKTYNGIKIKETEIGEKHYIMNRSEVDIDKLQQYYTQNLSSLFMKTQGAAMETDGMPSGLYFSWNETTGKTDMAASIPVKEPIAIKDASSHTIPSGRAIRVDYYGDYDNMEKAHSAIESYMKDYGLLVNYPIVQEYVTDPTEEKDVSKWLTKITYYVSESN